jgi:predicted ATPase
VLLERANSIEVQPHDIGVGISQVLPVIVAALHARNGFVIVEQPELHVHPGLQVALGDLFIEQTSKQPDLTFLLETHSEHLMLRFLRRIRESADNELPPGVAPLSPDSLSIYFSEQGENGITFLPIRVDREGEFIDRWPHGFFNERIGEI